jgi:hypothetical protein
VAFSPEVLAQLIGAQEFAGDQLDGINDEVAALVRLAIS